MTRPAIPAAGSARVEVGNRVVALSSLDRVLWPEAGFTKGDMLGYYSAVAPALLPRLRERALTMARFPEGVDGPGFGQTECRGAPDWKTFEPTIRTNVPRTSPRDYQRFSVISVSNPSPEGRSSLGLLAGGLHAELL